MEYEYILTPDGELYHWGIKGMKWGERRYQNKDGSLTPAGKKRYAKEGGDDTDASATPKKKPLGEMTDDEIRTAIARKQLENQYNMYHPQPVKPESFTRRFMNGAVKPAAISAGKKFVENALNKVAGDILKDKVDPNSLEGIKKKIDKRRAELELARLMEGLDDKVNWEALGKRQKLLKDMEEDEEKKKEAAAKKAEEDAEKAKQAAKEKFAYDEYNRVYTEPPEGSSGGEYSAPGRERVNNMPWRTQYKPNDVSNYLLEAPKDKSANASGYLKTAEEAVAGYLEAPISLSDRATRRASERGKRYVEDSSLIGDDYVTIVDEDGTVQFIPRDEL